MTGLRGWALYAVLLGLAVAAGIVGRQGPTATDRPSVDNPGPRGTRALYLYLEESGRPVSALRAPLTALPEGTAVLVLPAPDARKLEAEEVSAVRAFVERGGTLVYLAARPVGEAQPRLESWLGVSPGPAPALDPEGRGLEDPFGSTAAVRLPYGAAAGLRQLRVSVERTAGCADAAPVAGSALLWKAVGRGEVWIGAGADLAENRRLELLDNLRFWENLSARGPLVFDEHHHLAGPPPPLSSGILAFALQLLACTAFFALAHGTRFGPPRPLLTERHRSSLEYVTSLAWLTRQARVEPELAAELALRLRRLLHDRLGISPGLSDEEAARAIGEGAGIEPARFLDLARALHAAAARRRVPPAEYLRLSRAFAELERALGGRS